MKSNNIVNLQRSDILINYESPWSMAVKIQRNGRIHRINSEHDKVTIMNLVVNDTIDESILKTLERKESLNQSLVESTDSEVNIMNELLKEIEDK